MTDDTITSLPEWVSDAGLDFHWNVWTPDTELTLCNVPWNSDYRDIWRPNSQADLDAYIDSSPNLPIYDLSYLPFQRTVMVDTPINTALGFNYVRARNSLAPIPSEQQKTYYYFIQAVDYIAPETTALTLQLDVWQTFGYAVEFGPVYVERGHIGIANENAFDHYGRDYLSIPEGLDTGSDYRTVHIASKKIMDNPSDGGNYSILIVSTVDITQSTDTFGTPDSPQVVASRGSTFEGIPSGADLYIFKTADDFKAWILSMQEYPWVVQGIVSITIIPPVSRYYGSATALTKVSPSGMPPFYQPLDGKPDRVDTPLSSAWRDSSFIGNILGPRYAGLKKFLTAPYMMLELTTWTGSPILIRPELWQDPDATVRELAAFFPPGQRVAVLPSGYNADPETRVSSPDADPVGNDDFGEFLDMAAVLSNFPTVPIVSNNAGLWLAQNAHSIPFQFANARWDQQRALAGAQAGASNADAGIRNMSQQAGIYNAQQAGETNIGVQAAIGHGILGAGGDLLGASGRTAGSALTGGVADAALSAANTATTVMQMNASSALGQSTRNASTSANMGQAAAVRDTNFGYAQYAANGDYGMAVAGINARVQDSMMAQPSAQGQYGGDAFNLVNHYIGYSLRWKMLNLQTLRAIGDYWLRYGYAVHQFSTLPSDFQCMSKFTYWKLAETYIKQASIPEMFKQTIRGIFEKGVTVWRNAGDIGNIDWADNRPENGVAL